MINEYLKNKVESLVMNVQQIKDSLDADEEKSKQIMKLIRSDSIRIPLEYVNSFLFTRASLGALLKMLFTVEGKEKISDEDKDEFSELTGTLLNKLNFYSSATIDPSKVKNLEYDRDSITIYGNSFGPFSPQSYFKKGNHRIVWLLKEAYIEKESFLLGDRGEHNQAYEYVKYYNDNNEFGNSTFDELLDITRTLLLSLNIIKEASSNEEVMTHICILEANHFPGLAFNDKSSNDGLIRSWTRINKELLKLLIEFYNPQIIIGCQSFLGIFTPVCDMLNWFSDKNNNENSIYEIDGKTYPNMIFDKKIIKTWSGNNKHSMVKCEDGRYWINAYHPQQKKILNENIIQFANDILNDKTSK